MQYNRIHLKYIAFFIVLSLSWITHDTYADITSSGSSIFTNANSSSLRAYKSNDYGPISGGPPPAGEILHAPPYTIADAAQQIQWGTPFDDETPNCGGGIPGICVSAYTFEDKLNVPVTPNGTQFEVTDVTHFNRRIVGSLITFFDMDLFITLNIDGTDILIPDSVFSGITVDHAETPNPNSDIATWDSLPIVHLFTHGGIDYELTVLGFDPEFDPFCPGRCFITFEGTNRTAPIMAVLTASVPIPEPSTYLLLGSMVGFVIFLRYRKAKNSVSKVLKQRQDK
jgi:hypothetical protein